MSDTAPAHTNRLANETSPYLLQHAHNPVDWYPWGPEAFEKSRRENKPIFLSVGYSTCYWCHVMERQSFENETIAAQMNRDFVCIKVDREERPDVDQLYMTAVQVLTRQGGWPMSVFLAPDLRPFYGGTYFPPTDSHGRPGFPRILAAIDEAWKNRPAEISRSADELIRILKQLAIPQPPAEKFVIDAKWINHIIDRSTADFDPHHGGFGSAPKFPRQTVLELLLVYLRQNKNEALMQKVRQTLDAMADGGIRDHLGGGFHRYSTDEMWLVPHFEIMLYDNAMLLWIYAEAHAQTKDARYASVARGIADFVLRELTSPQGAFFTALDAEVDAQEGASYLWTREEVEDALKTASIPSDEITKFLRAYGLDAGPNFADPHAGHTAPDKNVLFLSDPKLENELKDARDALYAVRRQRKQPMLDTKILTSWNALMIRALAHAGQILHEDRYTKAATTAADYLLARHTDDSGALTRTGSNKFPAFLDDYAYLVQSLLTLGRRDEAQKLASEIQICFGDPSTGGFFFTSADGDDLIVRQKVATDNPLPSGNGIAALAMLDLDHQDTAAQTLGAFAGQLSSSGENMGALVQCAIEYTRRFGPLEIVPGEIDAQDRPLSPQELAARVLSVKTEWPTPTHLQLRFKLLGGFHILRDQFSITESTPDLKLQIPAGQSRKLAFDDAPQTLLEGDFAVDIHFPQKPPKPTDFSISFQACDDSACLPKSSLKITVAPP